MLEIQVRLHQVPHPDPGSIEGFDHDSEIALDGKVDFDDNSLYRHKEILEYRDVDEEDPLEVEASKFNLNYIKLDGNVGCCVNGAGLAMATMDLVKYYGGEPANFLDIGGSSSPEKVITALEIITSDENVRFLPSIFV